MTGLPKPDCVVKVGDGRGFIIHEDGCDYALLSGLQGAAWRQEDTRDPWSDQAQEVGKAGWTT
jgi:hypothetical protein